MGAVEAPIPSAPTTFITDEPAILSVGTRDRLESCLRDLQGRSGHQLVVYIGRSLDGIPIEDFAVHAFQQWGVGQRGKDDGLVLFVFPDDKKIRIEVGYGLEGDIPDAAASRVINDVMAPQLRAGNPDAAFEGAVASLVELMGEPPCTGVRPAASQDGTARPATLLEKIVFGVVIALLLLFILTHPRAALWLLVQLASSRRSGSGWQGMGGGGGGFSGGGGSSGGGGASGGW